MNNVLNVNNKFKDHYNVGIILWLNALKLILKFNKPNVWKNVKKQENVDIIKYV